MVSVLINAYAVSPSWGSELGVGWHWMIEIAKYCRVFVITEGQWRDEIEAAIMALPQRENIKMYYNPVSDRVRKMCWNQGDYRFYFHYAKWQKKTLEIAREIIKDNPIDIIHQLNMVGFREPGFLWKIDNIPFVWGPLGGMFPIKLNYIEGNQKYKYIFKNIANKIQLMFSFRVRNAIKRASVLITPVCEDSHEILRYFGKETEMIAETGIDKGCIPIKEKSKLDGNFNIMWVGKFALRKKLDLAMRSISMMKKAERVRLHIFGSGSPQEKSYYHCLAKELGINDNCIWYGNVENSLVKAKMRTMDILFFSSIHDLTSTVVPEAIQNRLPILCHDAMGFGPYVEEGKTGFKVPLVNPKQSIIQFSSILDRIVDDISILDEMKYNFDEPAKFLSFEEKGKRVFEMYNKVINQQN